MKEKKRKGFTVFPRIHGECALINLAPSLRTECIFRLETMSKIQILLVYLILETLKALLTGPDLTTLDETSAFRRGV